LAHRNASKKRDE
jgi:hypothetical protein